MTNVAALRNVPFLTVLPDAELERLAAQARPRRFRAGDTIFHREDPGSTLYIIERGRVKLVLASPEGREVTVGLLGPGDFFGELALLDGGPRSASVVALEPLDALTLDRAPFIAVLERHPEVAGALLAVLGDRLRQTDELIQDILFLDLPARLAKRLLLLAAPDGEPIPAGAQPAVHFSQTELAGMVGSTRESVNRCLNAYAERGLVALRREAIVLSRPDELQRRIY